MAVREQPPPSGRKYSRLGTGAQHVEIDGTTCKPCTACGETKPLDEYYNWSKGRDGKQANCKTCQNERLRQYKDKRPVRDKETKMRSFRRTKYGLSPEDYDDLLAEQSGVCAICGEECSSGRTLCVDHDHNTGRVRGLLCLSCNWLVGRIEKDYEMIAKALDYLQQSEE